MESGVFNLGVDLDMLEDEAQSAETVANCNTELQDYIKSKRNINTTKKVKVNIPNLWNGLEHKGRRRIHLN